MLKRLIENWLINISEREFDIPFRLLLEALGHVAIGHTTIHGAMELGKDIVSWHSEENLFYFFQLKAGDITPSDWSEMQRQLLQMVMVPYVHPNYQVGDPYQPIWVCTGQLHETVRLSMGLMNQEFAQNDKPQVQVWERNDLIERYHEIFYEVVFTDPALTIDFIRLWSHEHDFMTDEDELRAFFHAYLSQTPTTSSRIAARHLATFTLILTQLSQRYLDLGDLYSRIDCALLGIVQFYEWLSTTELTEQSYQNNLLVANSLLEFYLDELMNQCQEQPHIIEDLFEPDSGWSEIFELPLRAHSLASKIALRLLLNAQQGQDIHTEVGLLTRVVRHNPAFCHLISERQMGTFWIVILGLLRAGETDLAELVIAVTFNWFITFHGKEGLIGLPDPYQPYSFSVNYHLYVESDQGRLMNNNGQSYILPVLLKFVICLNQRDLLAHHWKIVSYMTVHEFRPTTPEQLFSYRSDTGIMATYGFPLQGSWSALKQQYAERMPADLGAFVDRYPESLLLLALVYPWRTQWRETERYTLNSHR